MQVALVMYQTRIESGKWAVPSSEQEEIQALKTELVQLKTLQKRNQSNNKNRASSKNKQLHKKGQKNAKAKDYPEWKKKTPTEAEKQAGNKKKVRDRWYYWCPNHKMWTSHRAEDCKGIEPGAKYKNNNKNQGSPERNNTVVSETLIAPYAQQVNMHDEESEQE